MFSGSGMANSTSALSVTAPQPLHRHAALANHRVHNRPDVAVAPTASSRAAEASSPAAVVSKAEQGQGGLRAQMRDSKVALPPAQMDALAIEDMTEPDLGNSHASRGLVAAAGTPRQLLPRTAVHVAAASGVLGSPNAGRSAARQQLSEPSKLHTEVRQDAGDVAAVDSDNPFLWTDFDSQLS